MKCCNKRVFGPSSIGRGGRSCINCGRFWTFDEIDTANAAKAAAEKPALVVRCNWCLAVLTEPGALLFTPHDAVGQCAKIHIGVNCGCYATFSRKPLKEHDHG